MSNNSMNPKARKQCDKCGVIVSNLEKHKRRKRCDKVKSVRLER